MHVLINLSVSTLFGSASCTLTLAWPRLPWALILRTWEQNYVTLRDWVCHSLTHLYIKHQSVLGSDVSHSSQLMDLQLSAHTQTCNTELILWIAYNVNACFHNQVAFIHHTCSYTHMLACTHIHMLAHTCSYTHVQAHTHALVYTHIQRRLHAQVTMHA